MKTILLKFTTNSLYMDKLSRFGGWGSLYFRRVKIEHRELSREDASLRNLISNDCFPYDFPLKILRFASLSSFARKMQIMQVSTVRKFHLRHLRKAHELKN